MSFSADMILSVMRAVKGTGFIKGPDTDVDANLKLKDYLTIGYIDEIGQILSDMEKNNRLELWEKAQYGVAHDLDDPNLRFVSN